MKNEAERGFRVQVDAYTRVCLTAIAGLLVLLIVGLWADAVPQPSKAGAAEPFLDASKQRSMMIKAQEQTNAKLSELIGLLKSGDARVQIGEPKSKPAKRTSRAED